MSASADHSIKTAEEFDLIKNYLANGGSVKELKGIEDADLDNMYKYARYLFTNEQYAEAKNIFFFLISLNQWEFNYSYYYACCMQALNQHEIAILYFYKSLEKKPDHQKCYYLIIKSLLALDNQVDAKNILTLLMTSFKTNPNVELERLTSELLSA